MRSSENFPGKGLKVTLLLLTTSLFFMSCHRHETVISGTLHGVDKKRVYLDELDINITKPLDSVLTNRNGKFRFRLRLTEPSFLLLKRSEQNFITLLAKPGEKIHVKADSLFLQAGYHVTGSEESLLIKQLDDHLRITVHKMDSIVQIYRQMMDKPGFDTLRPRLDKAYSDLLAQQRKYNIAFILDHMQSLSAIKALYQKVDDNTYVLNNIRDIQYLKIVADSLKVYYPDSKMTKALLSDLQKEMGKYNQLQLTNLLKNAKSVKLDLALPDIQGDTVYLSSLRKKGYYVLLTFWASWCQQCISENLELKSLYNKYHKKGLEIYAVSLDNNKDIWVKEVHFDELPWINVSDLSYPNSEAAQKFNVKTPPVNYLFDPEGNVIAKDLHGRNLQIKLNQLFD